MVNKLRRRISFCLAVLLVVSTVFCTGVSAATAVPKAKIKKAAFTAKTMTVTVTWNKIKKANGYQLEYATKKNFKGKKTITVKRAATVKKQIKKVTANKTYYIRVRAYRTVSGNKVYGKFSAKKSVKTNIKAGATKITKMTYSKKDQTVLVKWKKVSGASGYELQYATLKDFIYNETLNTEGAGKNSLLVEDLTIRKTYYFRVRSYVETLEKDGTVKTVYGKFSPIKELTTEPNYTVAQALEEKTVGTSTMRSSITGMNYKLKFIDDFNGTTLNSDNWSIDTVCAGGAEKQANIPENVEVANGNLILHANKDTVEHDQYVSGSQYPIGKTYYTGAKISSDGKKYFKYGRFEMLAQLPRGSGAWPAFWTLGEDRGWPWGGEIDILEMGGKDYNYYATIHWCDPDEPSSSAYGDGHKSIGVGEASLDEKYADKLSYAYHVIGMEWTQTTIYFYFDGEMFGSQRITQPDMEYAFHNPHFIIINYALGGMGGNIDNSALPQKFYVDWVKVWQTN